MDREALQTEFENALQDPDPTTFAKILEVPAISAQQKKKSNSKSKQRIDVFDGIDYSGVFNAWMDATQAALNVSI